MNKIVPGLLIAASFFYTSCSDEYTICESPVNVSLNAGFYKNIAGTDSVATPASFSVSVLNGAAILTNASNRNGFFASLNPATDTSRFVITIEGTTDTFKVAYSTQVQNVSVNCGDVNIYTLSAVSSTRHAIDSIKIVNPAVNTALPQNIRIFY